MCRVACPRTTLRESRRTGPRFPLTTSVIRILPWTLLQYTEVTVVRYGILLLLSCVYGAEEQRHRKTSMLQGDPDWWRLGETISNEDRASVIEHNAQATPEHHLYERLVPVPCLGAIATAHV